MCDAIGNTSVAEDERKSRVLDLDVWMMEEEKVRDLEMLVFLCCRERETKTLILGWNF